MLLHNFEPRNIRLRFFSTPTGGRHGEDIKLLFSPFADFGATCDSCKVCHFNFFCLIEFHGQTPTMPLKSWCSKFEIFHQRSNLIARHGEDIFSRDRYVCSRNPVHLLSNKIIFFAMKRKLVEDSKTYARFRLDVSFEELAARNWLKIKAGTAYFSHPSHVSGATKSTNVAFLLKQNGFKIKKE